MKCRPCGSNIIDQQHALGQVDLPNPKVDAGAAVQQRVTDLKSGARSPSEQ